MVNPSTYRLVAVDERGAQAIVHETTGDDWFRISSDGAWDQAPTPLAGQHDAERCMTMAAYSADVPQAEFANLAALVEVVRKMCDRPVPAGEIEAALAALADVDWSNPLSLPLTSFAVGSTKSAISDPELTAVDRCLAAGRRQERPTLGATLLEIFKRIGGVLDNRLPVVMAASAQEGATLPTHSDADEISWHVYGQSLMIECSTDKLKHGIALVLLLDAELHLLGQRAVAVPEVAAGRRKASEPLGDWRDRCEIGKMRFVIVPADLTDPNIVRMFWADDLRRLHEQTSDPTIQESIRALLELLRPKANES